MLQGYAPIPKSRVWLRKPPRCILLSRRCDDSASTRKCGQLLLCSAGIYRGHCIEYLSDFNPFYHSTNDLVTALDSSYLRDITRTGLAAICCCLTAGRIVNGDAGVLLPAVARLEQNYPNPFNPRTVVSSQLSVVSDVRIAIYDMSGTGGRRPGNERRAAGMYQDTFDGSVWPAGFTSIE